MKTYFTLFVVLSYFLINSCSSDSEDQYLPCGTATVIDSKMYDSANTEYYSIVSATIVDNCLELEISSSGCDGESWEAKLIDSGAIAESHPVQRFLKLDLVNEELCDAVINKKYSFDLHSIQLDYDTIIINLEKWNSTLTYVPK